MTVFPRIKRELMMQLSFKLLPWVLFTTITSVLGLGGNIAAISNYLPENITFDNLFSRHTVPHEILNSNNTTETIRPNTHRLTDDADPLNIHPLIKKTVAVSPLKKIWFTPYSIETEETPTSSNPFSITTLSGIDGTGGPQPVPSTGIEGTGGPQPIPPQVFEGTGGPSTPIIAFGKLQLINNCFFVNQITFCPTNETETILNGNEETDISPLSNGQVVLIKGSIDKFNKGIAETIIYTTNISGTITDITGGSITILEQKVIFHKDIVIEGMTTLKPRLEPGDFVNVSGFTLSNGDLSATYIERVNNSTEKLIGPISQLNELDKTFLINQLIVDYSQVTTLPVLSNGMAVNVKGVTGTQTPLTLQVDSIEIMKSIVDSIETPTSTLDTETTKVHLEGFITEYTSPSNFKVGNISIFTDFQTIFPTGDHNYLGLDRKIQVEGYFDVNNTLIAEKIIYLVATLTSHKDRDTLSGSTETFQWNNVNADAYRLVILYSNGKGIFYDEVFDKNTITATISGLPESNAKFQVQLYTQQDEFWSRQLYSFFGSGTTPSSQLTSHTPKEINKKIILQSSTETFTWSLVPGATEYHLRIYDYPTQTDYYNNTFNKPEDVLVSGLPTNSADINISLSVLHNGWWSTNHYDLISAPLVKNSTLTSHVNGAKLTSSTETFTWEDVGAEQYEFRVSRQLINGGIEILELSTFDGSTTSTTIENLPINSGNVSIRLRTKHSGWATKYYTFSGASIIPNAELTSHSHKDILTSSSEVFSWTEVPEAEEYYLKIYNPVVDGEPRFSENYNSFITTQTINNLPKNRAEVSLFLSTRHNGYWAHKKYRLEGNSELSNASITSHTSYQAINTSTITVTWDNVNSDGYFLKMQDLSQNSHPTIHKQVYGSTTTSAIIENLPKNAILSIDVSTKHGKWWGNVQPIIVITEIP